MVGPAFSWDALRHVALLYGHTWGTEPEASSEAQPKIEGMRVLEALAASGLRSIRYIKEVTEGVGIDRILVNDLEPHAVEAINRNLQHNGWSVV